MALPHDSRWTVVLPVKSLGIAKSRLAAGEVGPSIARAFLLDTLAAVGACPTVSRVVIATHDEEVAGIGRDHGCEVFDDTASPGINAAAATAALGMRPPVAVLVSDLPCLTPDALSAVLDVAIDYDESFLADAAGTGTTMWLTTDSVGVRSHFGTESAQAHRAAGAIDLVHAFGAKSAIAAARRDVDTDADLRDALALGVGRHTRTAIEMTREGIVVTAIARRADGVVDAADESGRRHRIEASAVVAAGFRDVRPGQRLVLRSDGRVTLP